MGLRATLYAISPEEHEQAVGGDPDFSVDVALDLDKAWHAIHVLLTGDTALRFLTDGATVLDAGDCLVEVHAPDAVARLRDRLAAAPPAQLMQGFDADRFNAADIYPGRWDAPGEAYVADHLQRFADFVTAAATHGQALAVVLA